MSAHDFEAKHHRQVFRYFAAVLNRYVLASSVKQCLVDILFVRCMGKDLTVFDSKILVEFGELNQHPLVTILFFDFTEPHKEPRPASEVSLRDQPLPDKDS